MPFKQNVSPLAAITVFRHLLITLKPVFTERFGFVQFSLLHFGTVLLVCLDHWFEVGVAVVENVISCAPEHQSEFSNI